MFSFYFRRKKTNHNVQQHCFTHCKSADDVVDYYFRAEKSRYLWFYLYFDDVLYNVAFIAILPTPWTFIYICISKTKMIKFRLNIFRLTRFAQTGAFCKLLYDFFWRIYKKKEENSLIPWIFEIYMKWFIRHCLNGWR